MQNIQRNKTKLQTFLEWLKFIFHLFFGEFPLPEGQPYICPVKVADATFKRERAALKRAVAAFELKKCGGVAR